MNIRFTPLQIEFDNEPDYVNRKIYSFYIQIFIIESRYAAEKECFGFFYNDGAVILTFLFKEFVLRRTE